MKSIIAAVITCMVLFGASFAASKYYIALEAAAAAENAEEPVEPKPDEVDQDSTLPPDDSQIKKVDEMPVAHRPEQSVSLVSILQMSDAMKKLEEKLRIREMKLRKEEQRVKLLFVDVETEQDRLQAYSDGIDAKVKALADISKRLKEQMATMSAENAKEMAALDQKKAEIAALEKDAGVDDESKRTELENKVNGVKSWFANLEAKQASDYLKEFANNGKLDFAASLLNKMPDRQKSKILAELSDPSLVDQLIGALQIKPKK